MTEAEDVIATLEGTRYFCHVRPDKVWLFACYERDGDGSIYMRNGKLVATEATDLAFALDAVKSGDWKEISYVDADRLLSACMAPVAVDHAAGAGHPDRSRSDTEG